MTDRKKGSIRETSMKTFQMITIDSQHTPRSRRILAVVLVVCLAALQCMLLSPVLTERAYAAGDITVDAEYQDDSSTYASQTVSGSTLDDLKHHSETIVDEETGEEHEISGPTLKSILNKTGISSKVDKVIVGGYEVDGWSNEKIFLVDEGGSYNLYKGKELLTEGVDNIYVKRSSDLKPVSFKSRPASNKTSPTVGETIKISYKLSVDEFYKKSEGFNMNQATRLTWSANKKVTLKNKTTTGLSGSVKAVVKKPGTIKISPNSDEFSYMTDGVSVSFTGVNTTTQTTTRTYTTSYRPTYTTRSTYTVGTTGSTAPMTTATRPAETTETMAPSYQTIRVKEVYLMETAAPVDPAEDPWAEDDGWTEDEWGDESTDETYDEEESQDNGVSFPAAAGSAAAALAACGAGAVGRIRRFRADMGPAPETPTAEKSATGKSATGKSVAEKPAETAPDIGEKKSDKNPLKKFRRKK